MTNKSLDFQPLRLPEEIQILRGKVRAFIQEEINAGTFSPDYLDERWEVHQAFAKKVARQGWIGLTWPREYGGQERSFLERFVINEEMMAFNAPVGAYFVADRQSGPTLIKYGSEQVKKEVLPKIVSGDVCFAIGMSEPDSGSDLFAAKCKATKVEGGWRINGTKIWTTNAHVADYMIGIFRTSPPTEDNRRHGLTSFLVDMRAEGIQCNPIEQMSGIVDFNEVVFNDVFIPENYLLGEVDGAWKQATSELAYERSGPERFLETLATLRNLVALAGPEPDDRLSEIIGRLVAELHALRRMSVSIANMLEAGREPVSEAAIVKDLGTLWEQDLPHKVWQAAAMMDKKKADYPAFEALVNHYVRISPKLTIQGGTTEILRGIIARELGLR